MPTADLMAFRPYTTAMLCSEGNKECIPSAVRVTRPRIAWHIEGIARDQGVWIHHLLLIVRYSRHSAVYLSTHIRIDPVQSRSHEMDARPLILLAAGFAALVYVARRLRKAWSVSRGEQNRFRSFVLPLTRHHRSQGDLVPVELTGNSHTGYSPSRNAVFSWTIPAPSPGSRTASPVLSGSRTPRSCL